MFPHFPMSGGPLLPDAYAELYPGRSVRSHLRGPHRGCGKCTTIGSCSYTFDVLDAKEDTEVGTPCVVFLVPPQRAEEWLFSSSEGQWQVVGDTKASRLILVTMKGTDHDNDIANMKDDICTLVRRFLPSSCRSNAEIDYLTQDNCIKARQTLILVESTTTGSMLVEDVALEEKPASGDPADELFKCYRRLTFRRNPNMIQSEARLVRNGGSDESKRKGRRVGDSSSRRAEPVPEVFEGFKVDHSLLTSDYHDGMIAAFVLNVKILEQWLAAKEKIKVMVLGLGAGLLPMFVHCHLPMTDIEVVEIDAAVGDIAKHHFGFVEDRRMKLQIEDGVFAVKAVAATAASKSKFGSCLKDCRLHVLMVDTDSRDPSDGLSCPAPEFLEDSFLLAGRQALRDGGMLIVNVVARSQKFHVRSKSQLKKYFAEVYEMEVDKDVCQVLIAMVHPIHRNELASAVDNLAKFSNMCSRFTSWAEGPNLQGLLKSLKRVD